MEGEYQTTQGTVPSGVINFALGHPGPELLPQRLLAKAASATLNRENADCLQYGHEYGGDYFRESLSHFLSGHCGVAVSGEHLMATNGVSQALDLICHCYTRRGDVVFVEEPSYFLGLDILRDHGLTIVPLALDEKGLSLGALEEALRQHRPRLLYTIPVFHNPAAVTLATERRKRLVALAAEHNFLLICDEVYHLLNFKASPVPPPMRAFDPGTQVLALGSFSKIMAPGLRLGWIEADPSHLQRLSQAGLILSGGGLNPFAAELMRRAVDLGLQDENVKKLRQVYAKRAAILHHALCRALPDVSCQPAQGGFFLWAKFPSGFDAAAFNEYAAGAAKVHIKPGPAFSSQRGLQSYARLCFAYHDERALEEGVARLAAVYRRWQERGPD